MSNFVVTVLTIVGFVLIMLLITVFLYKSIEKWNTNDDTGNNGEVTELREEHFGNDEMADLVRSFNSMEGALKRQMENVAVMTAERERVHAELSVATKIQADMLPTNFPERDDFSLFATMSPAKEVGGDFYDFFMIDEDHLGLVMADVSGKGVPAALFMVIAKTLIKNRAALGGSPARVLEDVNDMLCENNASGLFVTVWFSILEISTGTLTVCNAGHEYPVLRRSGGDYELVESDNLPPLATMEEMEYEDVTITLNAGDELFLYTDGVPEAKSSSGKRFGTDKMLEVLNGSKDTSIKDQLKNLKSEIDSFTGGGDPFDDITMLMLRVTK